MENLNRLNKMIETLVKFARDGRDTEQTRRLSRNLREIKWAIELKKITEADIASVVAKQSLRSAVEASASLVANIEKLALLANLSERPQSLESELADTQWQEDI